MRYNWIPLHRVGEFRFNEPIGNYFASHVIQLVADEYDSNVHWDVYTVPDVDVRIYVSDGQITSIACHEKCIYKGQNLIGMPFERALALIGLAASDGPEKIEVGDDIQEVFYFDEVEAQIWVLDGAVATVFCSPQCEDDDG